MPATPSKRPVSRLKQGLISAGVALALGGFVFLPPALEGRATSFAAALGFVSGTSTMLGLMRARRLYAWFVGLFAGYVIGLADGWQLVIQTELDGNYDVGLVTAFVISSFGFMAGMVAEFIRFLHTLSHGLRKDKAEKDDDEHGKWSATTTS